MLDKKFLMPDKKYKRRHFLRTLVLLGSFLPADECALTSFGRSLG
jgi:hypothetical protein